MDDLLIACKDLSDMIAVKKALDADFTLNELWEVRRLLVVQVDMVRAAGTVKLSNPLNVEEVLESFGMADCAPVATPTVKGFLQIIQERAKRGSGKVAKFDRYAE